MQQSFEIMMFETRHLSKQNDNAPSKIKMAPFKVHNDIPINSQMVKVMLT